LLRLKKKARTLGLKGIGSGSGSVRMTDHFGPLSSFVENPGTGRPGESVEVMVHPGHPNYAEETELLHSDWWNGMPFEVTLIPYFAL